MATRFMCKALLTAALGIAVSPLPAATIARSPASSNTAGAVRIDPPAAPSNCKTKSFQVPNPFYPHGQVSVYTVSWTDNSSNEDGFTVEQWWRNQSGVWVLGLSVNVPANSTAAGFDGRAGPNVRFRVKAFNAAGDSAWSNWH